MRRGSSLFAWVGVACVGTACVEVADFDPVGSTAAVRGSWQIDGQCPTQALCDCFGAARVKVVFIDREPEARRGTGEPAAERVVAHTGLRFACAADDCANQEAAAFETSGRVVARGNWTVALEAATGDDRRVARIDLGSFGSPACPTNTGLSMRLDAGGSDPCAPDAPRTPASFDTGRVCAGWVVGGSPPDDALCEAIGVDRVELQVSGGGVERTVQAPCGVSLESPTRVDGSRECGEPSFFRGGLLGTRVPSSACATAETRSCIQAGSSACRTYDVRLRALRREADNGWTVRGEVRGVVAVAPFVGRLLQDEAIDLRQLVTP